MSKKYFIYLNICLSIVCFAHIGSILYDDMNAPPQVKVYDRKLEDIEFPLIFKICLYEIRNSTLRYQKYGYEDFIHYYRGKSMYHNDSIGWFGHMENGSTIASSEGM